MENALVAYATTHGHTARIAGRIAEILRERGLDVDLVDVAAAGDVDPGRYDVVAIGGSVHAGHHQRALVDWVKARGDALSASDAAFFSVSLTAAEDTAEARAATAAMVSSFATDSGWEPARTATFAGALQYREYDFFTRTLMRLLMKRGGHPSDASRDYDFTDWDAVARFARDLPTVATAGAGPSHG